MNRSRNFAWPKAAFVTALICGCSNSLATTAPTGSVVVAVDKATVNNDGTKVNVTVTTLDASGKPGTGTVTFTVAYGDINGTGNPTGTGTLDATGTAKVTYACNIASNAKCTAGPILIGASWNSLSGSVVVAVASPAGTGGTDGGTTGTDGGTTGTDGGTGGTPIPAKIAFSTLFPAYVIVSGAANATDLPGTATATFVVNDQTGAPFKGASVAFAEQPGENLITVGTSPGTTDATGSVTVTVTGKTVPGTAHLVATLAGQPAVVVPVPVIGSPTSIVEVSSVPTVLGVKGSGFFETGLMTFKVTDSFGTPVPNVSVTFAQAQPNIVAITLPTQPSTDATGSIAVSYASGIAVGVSTLTATVVDTGASASQAIAVRGAKPSGLHFDLKCDKANLPAYTTTNEFFSVTCTAKLADRNNNRIGIATPVAFAAEAGAINASATTTPFDPTPGANNDNEGVATVTFSTDMGNGFQPVDVAPLAALATQAPFPRPAEPFVNDPNGGITRNPRDQLVTIIAMVRGEEGFIDQNGDGAWESGELLYDLSDPYIDSNDNNQWDPDERRFCGLLSCATFHGPNQKWDPDTILWTPTWVVFSDFARPKADPWLTSSCLTYSDGAQPTATTQVSFLDFWLNPPASGTTYAAALAGAPPGAPTVSTLFSGSPELDSLGAMGGLHHGYDWVPVWESDATKLCVQGNYPATGLCVNQLQFYSWDAGYRLVVQATDGTKTSAAAGPACSAGSGPGFTTAFTASENAVTSTGTLNGFYSY